MRLWSIPEGTIPSNRSRLNHQACRAFAIGLSLVLCAPLEYGSSLLAAGEISLVPVQRPQRSSPHVGSAMAVLATLEQAQVLPPEGTREADRIIQSVIQFQSAFAKGTDRPVQDFAQRALTDTYGEEATALLERFRASGWTAELLEALADAAQRTSTEELERLAAGFGQFNLSVDDFKRFMQLVRDSRSALAARGQNFEEVYAHHRKAMPGAAAR
jgi:hypothetical protein